MACIVYCQGGALSLHWNDALVGGQRILDTAALDQLRDINTRYASDTKASSPASLLALGLSQEAEQALQILQQMRDHHAANPE